MRLPRATGPIALASIVSMAAQALFSLVMLRLYAPEAVGEFSVVSQIAFFWMTLAMAQSPLKLLADIHRPPIQALRAALGASLLRLGLLVPIAWMAAQFSGQTRHGALLGWAALLALLQLGWYLAQPITLKVASIQSIALGRVVPPVMALAVAGVIGSRSPQAGANGLLLAAASGYGIGALWLLSPRREVPQCADARARAAVSIAPTSSHGDDRSGALRMAHAAADALTGAAILLLWQRSHGAAEAGQLAVLLRVLGFVPAMIHAAWAQVLLTEGASRRRHAAMAGMGGAFLVIVLALACALALRTHWLPNAWAGVLPYLLPLVLWQGAACLLAAFSHLPFQHGRAGAYSFAAIGFDALQLIVLCTPLVFSVPVSASEHAWWLGGASAAGLLILGLWLVRLQKR